jgi:hypothetical protein
MRLTSKQSKKLKNRLPQNWWVLIKERLEIKGKRLSAYWIHKVVCGKEEDNHQIIEEALSLAIETEAKAKNTIQKLNSI